MPRTALKKASFDFWGLPVEMTSNHPLLYREFLQDLKAFQCKRPDKKICAVQWNLRTLPHPGLPDIYKNVYAAGWLPDGRSIARYGQSSIAVVTDERRRRIWAGVSAGLSVVPDPAYHLCFTHPISLWLKERGKFFLHAGCVSSGSSGVLIVGPSRAGKSTLTLAAVRAGFKFLSDEQPVLVSEKEDLKILAFPRRVRLQRAMAGLFPQVRCLKGRLRRDDLIFSVEEAWPGTVATECRPRLLIFPKYRQNSPIRLKKISAVTALGELMKDEHFIWYKDNRWNRVSLHHASALERLAQSCPAFRLEYSHRNILQTPEIFLRLLRSSDRADSS